MSRIRNLFERKKKNILSIYCTAGYPGIDSTPELIKALEESGVDMVELGMPYSDPLADGPVIQETATIAIQNGMSISKLFDQLRSFRKEISIPVLLMGYINPVLQYGFDKFCKKASEAGVDGLIIPDLPAREFEKQYAAILKKYHLDFVFMVTPETSDERIRKLDALSSGFLYLVSSSSTTGQAQDMKNVKLFLNKVSKMGLANPLMVGFGIRDARSFWQACESVQGAIIGTAYLVAIRNSRDPVKDTRNFVQSITRQD